MLTAVSLQVRTLIHSRLIVDGLGTNKGKPVEEVEECSKITAVSVHDPFSGIDPMWATKRGN